MTIKKCLRARGESDHTLKLWHPIRVGEPGGL